MKLHEVTLAAHGVLGTLGKRRLDRVERAIRCLSASDVASRPLAKCEPVQTYRAEFERVSRKR